MKIKISFGLILLTLFCCVSAFSQKSIKEKEILIAEFKKLETSLFPVTENQCQLYGKTDFAGSRISMDVIDMEFQDILNHIGKPCEIKFVVDKSIEQSKMSKMQVKFTNLPWNVALNFMLKGTNLCVEVNYPVFRITNNKSLKGTICEFPQSQSDDSMLHTEFVKLENLKLKPKIPRQCTDLKKSSSEFLKFLSQLVTRRGAVEVDTRSHVLIITDSEKPVKLISDFVKLLDELGFTVDELVNEVNFIKK